MPTGTVVKMARVGLGLSQQQLADLANVSLHTVLRIEAEKSSRTVSKEAIVRVLEDAGIEFLPATDSGGEGLRLPRAQGSSTASDEPGDSG